MSLTAKAGENFQLTPEGTHLARCFRIVDLGTQHNEQFSKFQHKILISWELPAELMEDGRPFSVSKRYTLSLGEKSSLRADLEAWRGRAFTEEELQGFDIKKLIGATCYLNIAHKKNGEKTYTNITAIMKLPKGIECPPAVNPPTVLELEPESFAIDVFEGLSDKLKDTIRLSPEYKNIELALEKGLTDSAPQADDVQF